MMESSRISGSSSTAAAPVVSLETELTCSICTDLLYQPLTLLDCLHTFCGACLKEWFSWQAVRAENAPGPPPPPEKAIFTCPSCREKVRDTRHDARVATLLEMFLALSPGKGKTEEEMREMDEKWKKGDPVMPKLSFANRTREQIRVDNMERQLLEEVQELSLREATEAAVRGSSGRPSGRSRDPSRVRESDQERRRRRRTAEGEGAESSDERRRRRRSESRQRAGTTSAITTRRGEADEGRIRQIEHQSSLRSLISSDGMDVREFEREIEEFARQIHEEGLLDGLDLENIDLQNNDELSRKITEAYRRRHRDRLRNDGGRRSNASAHSHRSDASGRPRSTTGEASRPTSRHTVRSRAPSAHSDGERARYPPSSSTQAHLEIQDSSRRRGASSSGRSATVPVPANQPEARLTGRSQTDLGIRASDVQPQRPSMGTEMRATSSPTTVTSPTSRGDSPHTRTSSSSAVRTERGLGITQPRIQSEPTAEASSSPRSSASPLELTTGSDAIDFAPTSGPLSAGLNTPPLVSPRRGQPLPRYKEPLIRCNTCQKEHIEYDLHFNCAICHHGEWNICLDCWRRRKGCLHWFGFGASAWAKWEKQKLTGPPAPPPHVLVAHRYLPPRAAPGGAEGRRTITTESPADRLQTGAFCSCCAVWTNDCYWRCDSCNEGEWGFCSDCVNQGKACSHPLQPLTYHPPAGSPRTASPSGGSGSNSRSSTPPGTSLAPAPVPQGPGTFHQVPTSVVLPTCELCRNTIPRTEQHYHCHSCPSSLTQGSTKQGGYNLCNGCYTSLVTTAKIAAENGPAGWRRCLHGHRMIVVGFTHDYKTGDVRRKVLKDWVGGRRLRFELAEGKFPGMQVCSWKDSTGTRLEKLVALDVAVSTAGKSGSAHGHTFTEDFPPDGGFASKAVAGWGWIPSPDVQDELLFPKGAEILEVEDVNQEWFHGFYMGSQGLFPAPYVKLSGR
ncbi:E3 ubiquitin-protein ligase [Podospora australis]|uniref:E3 ubiquitin-protein ligase n=1 Tax=Podospora australis TaxID=1536484 RepID=A0AAN6WRR8_9PEZI|nr:E3 ubiquitin-protein ligase [Podospora australis]